MTVIRRRAKARRRPPPSGPAAAQKIRPDRFVCLEVKEVGRAGALLDVGADEELRLPASEQSRSVRPGQRVVAYVHRDPRTGRIIASTRLERFFSDPPDSLEEGAEVQLLPYARTDLGFNAVVEGAFKGLLYHDATIRSPRLGVPITGYVAKRRADGRIDLSLQPSGVRAIRLARERLLDALRASGGRLALGDKSSPEAIRGALGLSKKAFKKAAGALYRERRIELGDDSIELLHEPTRRYRRSRNEDGRRR